jgi:hypothetical protein
MAGGFAEALKKLKADRTSNCSKNFILIFYSKIEKIKSISKAYWLY